MEITREQEAAISRMADVFSAVRVSPVREDGTVEATGGRWTSRWMEDDYFRPEHLVVLDEDGRAVA